MKSPKCPDCGKDLRLLPSPPAVDRYSRLARRYDCAEHGAFRVTVDGELESAHDNPRRPGDPTLEDDEFA